MTTTTVNQHGETPPDLKSPVYRSASPVVGKSPNAAGGEIPKEQYITPAPLKREFVR
jgi:hypothetical protein